MTIYLYPQSLFWGAFIIGLAQWPVLKRFIPDPNAKKRVLWILATWLGPGLGIFARWFFLDILFTDIERLSIGAAMGNRYGIGVADSDGASAIQIWSCFSLEIFTILIPTSLLIGILIVLLRLEVVTI